MWKYEQGWSGNRCFCRTRNQSQQTLKPEFISALLFEMVELQPHYLRVLGLNLGCGVCSISFLAFSLNFFFPFFVLIALFSLFCVHLASSNDAPETSKSSPKKQRRAKAQGARSTSDSNDPTANGIDQSNVLTSSKEIDYSLATPVSNLSLSTSNQTRVSGMGEVQCVNDLPYSAQSTTIDRKPTAEELALLAQRAQSVALSPNGLPSSNGLPSTNLTATSSLATAPQPHVSEVRVKQEPVAMETSVPVQVKAERLDVDVVSTSSTAPMNGSAGSGFLSVKQEPGTGSPTAQQLTAAEAFVRRELGHRIVSWQRLRGNLLVEQIGMVCFHFVFTSTL